MSDSDSSDFEETHTGLRMKWLPNLKIDELKALCSNRHIDYVVPATNKKGLIESILASKAIPGKHKHITKADLSIELKAKGVKHSESAPKTELKRILNKHKSTKPTIETLNNLKVTELHRLCFYRDILTRPESGSSSKERYIKLLQENDLSQEPEWNDSMTTKQLSAEMKARGLSIATRMKKEDMLKVLESGVIWEEQLIESHLEPDQADKVVDAMEEALDGLIGYIRGHSKEIQQNIKKNVKAQRRDSNGKGEWGKIEETLRTARDEIMDMKAMVEVYSGHSIMATDEMKDGPGSDNGFENVVPYDNDSDINENYGAQKVVYVVYEDDERLIMQQKRDAILGVFESEQVAEEWRDSYLEREEDSDLELAIQEVWIHDENGN